MRVGTYNLYLGADLSLLLGVRGTEELAERRAEVARQLRTTAFPGRAAALAQVVADEAPDVLAVQEACTWWADGTVLWDFAEELLPALEAAGAPYDVVVAQPTFGGSGSVVLEGRPTALRFVGSNALLVRRGGPVVVTGTDGGTFAAALHAPWEGDPEQRVVRGWCSARCRVGGTELLVVCAHTEAYAPLVRDAQRDELLALLPADGPLVIAGDLNATPDAVGLPGWLVDAWPAGGGTEADGATSGQAPDLANERSALTARIDYVLVRGARVEGCRRVGAEPADRRVTGMWPSDHAAVVADLRLPAGERAGEE